MERSEIRERHSSWHAARITLRSIRATPSVHPALFCSRSTAQRLCGNGSPRFSRSVLPSYSVRNRPRRCSSGMSRSTMSSSPRGTVSGKMLKPSAAPPRNQCFERVGDFGRGADDDAVAALAVDALVELAHGQILAARQFDHDLDAAFLLDVGRRIGHRAVERQARHVETEMRRQILDRQFGRQQRLQPLDICPAPRRGFGRSRSSRRASP